MGGAEQTLNHQLDYILAHEAVSCQVFYPRRVSNTEAHYSSVGLEFKNACHEATCSEKTLTHLVSLFLCN